ncbi:MAG TPA: hypothetical protein VHC23_11230 [Jatrophihabitans sp.]|nr:hypothetical protein [Jatrophihabitans sp.]
MRTRRPASVAGLLLGVAVLAGCTGVPTSSSPQTVEQLNIGVQPTEQEIRPAKDASPRDIVTGFLRANTIDPGKHTSAGSFLTTAARSRWSDATVTILSDDPAVGTYDGKGAVTVSGRVVGTLDKDGAFQPGSNVSQSFRFGITRDHGQFRISQAPAGLLITNSDFADNYHQYSLYFYDNENRYLVQDPRWTDIVDRTQRAQWLLGRLADGPRAQLQKALTSDTLPTQADPSRLTVRVNATTTIEIPGSSQLDSSGKNHLAAQVSQTLNEATSGGDMTITDGGRPVAIPAVSGRVFTPEEFTSALGPQPPAAQVDYVSGGALVNSDGKPVAGPLGHDTYGLGSVALSRPDPTGPMLVAGVQASTGQLWVGSQGSGLKSTGLSDITTRPTFASGRPEVWVGSGDRIYRVTLTATGTFVRAVAVAVTQQPAGRLLALRLSPDGARVAIVLGGPKRADGGDLYVGAVVRDAGPVSVDTLQRLSPKSVKVVDVAWLNQIRLLSVGQQTSPGDSVTVDTWVDGDVVAVRDIGLPRPPDSVTVAVGANAWLSAAGFVWVQSGGQWTSPTGGQTPGTAPIYVE